MWSFAREFFIKWNTQPCTYSISGLKHPWLEVKVPKRFCNGIDLVVYLHASFTLMFLAGLVYFSTDCYISECNQINEILPWLCMYESVLQNQLDKMLNFHSVLLWKLYFQWMSLFLCIYPKMCGPINVMGFHRMVLWENWIFS